MIVDVAFAGDSAGTALVLSTRPALLVSSSCSSIASNWSFVFISEHDTISGSGDFVYKAQS